MRPRRTRRLHPFVGGLIIVAAVSYGWAAAPSLHLTSAAAASSAAASSGTPTFGEPTVSGVQGNGFEQDVRLSPDGTIYTSAPASLSSAISYIWRSLDGGKTFKWVPGIVQPVGKPPTCVGGGDSELATDSSNNLYFNVLTLANFSTARSPDHGRTFPTVSCAGTPDAAVDRQWYTVDGNPTTTGNIFLAYDRVGQASPVLPSPAPADCTAANASNNLLVLARSPLPAGQALAGVQFAPSQALSCDEGIMGNDEFFNYKDTGKRVFVIHDNNAFNSISMARCDVIPFVPSTTGLGNCVNVLISSFPYAKTGTNFPTMTVDKAGHLFAIWGQEAVTGGVPGGTPTGDTVLMYSTSHDEGNTWSTPKQLPTPGLHTNVFAWPAAGDDGRIDVAWYGTPVTCDATCVAAGGAPDHVKGDWSLWMAQTLDDGTHWTPPLLASEHFTHRGNIQTVLGGQTGDRTLGDFLQLRIGKQGEANISYADSNSQTEASTPQAFFVKQNGGSGVFASNPTVHGDAKPVNSVTDPAGDATFDSAGNSSGNLPNLDILGSSISMPDSAHYRVTMKIANLTSLTPDPSGGGPTLVWNTQWHVPSATDPNGGKYFFVYMESTGGGAPVCYSGENAETAVGGGVSLTYPGMQQITGSACTYTAGAPGKISITVPLANVAEVAPISNILYSVTASTMTAAAPPENFVPPVEPIGGELFNLIDVARGYDFNPAKGG